jgi:type IV pilus assembly protein PilN
MRVSINLASQPYENLRPLYIAVTLALVLAVALGFAVGWKAHRSRNETRLLSEHSDRLEKDLVNLRREEPVLAQWLFRPEVQDIRDRSAFLNSLIVRKSLSWTELFMDLEKVLPDKVQVTAIQPSPNESAEAKLNMTVSSMTVAPLVELLKNLEASPEFAKPVVGSQRFPTEKSADPTIALELSVLYHQSAAPPPLSAPEKEPAAEQQNKEKDGKPSASLLEAPMGDARQGGR